MRIVCQQTILMKYHALLFFLKNRQNLKISSAANYRWPLKGLNGVPLIVTRFCILMDLFLFLEENVDETVFYGNLMTFYKGTQNISNGGYYACHDWTYQTYYDDTLFTLDGSRANARDYCRAISVSLPWCYVFYNDAYGTYWNYCDSQLSEYCGGTLSYGSRCKKTSLWGLTPGHTQNNLLSCRD